MTILKSKLDVLIAARSIIADEARWTQGTEARDSEGVPVKPSSDDAVCWCSVGAVDKVTNTVEGTLALCALGETADAVFFEFNDTHSHAEVLAVWDETIQRVSEEGVA